MAEHSDRNHAADLEIMDQTGWELPKADDQSAPVVTASPPGRHSFQSRVLNWMMACFSNEVCHDRKERNHRFLEEALELVQSLGCTRSEAHQLVDYVYGRPVGEPKQELGGVMVTVAALCFPNDLNMVDCGEAELARIWTKMEEIRKKQAGKPKHSPLPQAPTSTTEG